MDKEDFILKILNSLEGISKAIPEDAVFQRINQRIKGSFVSQKLLLLAAASIIILISVNIALVCFTENDQASEGEIMAHSINKSNQIY